MKKFISALVMASALVSAMPVSASTSIDDVAVQARLNSMIAAVNAHQVEQVSVYSERHDKDISEVMRLNGIPRDEAITRIAHALFSMSGAVPKSKIPVGYGQVYDPATHTFRQAYTYSFYAGVDSVTGQAVFTTTNHADMDDSFWYCAPGKVLTYEAGVSSCK